MGLIVEQHVGGRGDHVTWRAEVVGYADGPREQAVLPPPEPARPAPPPADPDRLWDADVPERPSWLGRDDLP
ncbi:hypothetical protein ACFOSC_31285 [Streptantibioticus rubrisoli]|uniref:Uncharacterized protein n=1 Tax=Streptantibioticus rubrisoli TaxID=1387313 RepID=A0ABT1PI69_9ACTN|nr:hypothetical protein [Streptantibioticus rubrisoli]MCQ4045053.1 hypothetical protein [Streptantibioticus rubrisoli]